MADEKPNAEKAKFDPFKPAEPHLPGVPDRKPDAPQEPKAPPGSRSGPFTLVVPVTVKWTSPAGKFFTEEAVARNVDDRGGLLQMKVLPLVAQTIQITSKPTGQTTEARVLAINRSKDGTVQGITVEFPAPLESFWGAPLTPPGAEEQPAAAPPSKLPAVVVKLISQAKASPKRAAAIGGGAVVLLVLVLWMAFGSGKEPVAPPQAPTNRAAPTVSSPAANNAPKGPAPEIVTLPATVATTQEMARTWSHKKFIIRRFGNRIPAMVLRIPVGSAGSSSGYWGFTLETSSGRCELEVVTDLPKLASDFGYRAQHPMVVDPCTQTVFDPMRMGSIGPSTYTRGEVVRGTALRPPIAIEIQVQRGEVIAVRTE